MFRRKAVENPVAKPNAKKICVNFSRPNKTKTTKKAYVWKYFEEENGRDFCKIIVFKQGEEVECGTNYKHDGGTGNMKIHLQSVHGIILGLDDSKSNSSSRVPLTTTTRVSSGWVASISMRFGIGAELPGARPGPLWSGRPATRYCVEKT